MKKIIIVTILNFIFLFSVFSEKFRFQNIPGSKQKIEAVISGKLLQNNNLVKEYNQQYKRIRTFSNDKDNITDNFYFYIINNSVVDQALEVREFVSAHYSRDEIGKTLIPNNTTLPTLRNVPVFPAGDINPGDQWIAPATEVQDIFGDKTISVFPIEVRYTFLGYEDINNKKIAKFMYEFEIDITNSPSMQIDSRISRVIGKSKTFMYFDNASGTQIKEEYSRHYAFSILAGYQQNVVEFVDSGYRIWYPIELMNKDKLVKDLKQKLEEKKVENTEVEKNEQGIKISIEDVHFYPDSSMLLPGESERVGKIAEILKDYKDRGVMVIGHTTDKGTEEGRKKLSIERAKVIVEYLKKLDAIDISKSSYTGKGGAEPVADNSTEEGMKKNRRVEIYILEE